MIRNLKIIQILLIAAVAAVASAEKIYVCTADGYVIGFDGINRGANNLYGGAGDTSFASTYVGKSMSCIVSTNWTAGPQNEIIVGTDSGTGDGVLVYDASLEHVLGDVTINKAITSLAAGSIGEKLNQAIAVGTNAGSLSELFIYDNNLDWVYTKPIGTPITSVRLAELEAAYPNNEIILSAILGTIKSTCVVSAYRLFIDGNNDLTMSPIWPSWGPSTVVTNLVVYDLYPGFDADEFILVGNSSDISGNIAGDGQQAYSYPGGGSVPEWQWWSNLDHIPTDVTVAGAVGELFSGNPGPELVVVGDSKLYIIDADSISDHAVNLQTLETNQPCTSVAIGDVVGQDGIDDIIVGSAGGIIIVYEHTDLGDLNSPFAMQLDGSRGGVLSLDWQGNGTEYQITDLVATAGCSGDNTIGNFDGDCDVDVVDLMIFVMSWLETSEN